MISFLEMVQQFPIGIKVTVNDSGTSVEEEVTGYEYYNGTGYLLVHGSRKLILVRKQEAIGVSVKGR